MERLTVTKISNENFELIVNEWNDLHAAMPNGSFFQNWHWNYAWWGNFNNNRKLFVLTLRAGKDLVGIIPLYQEKRTHWAGLSLKVLSFLGTEKVSSDYLGVLCRPDYERAVIWEFLNYLELAGDQWDNLQLFDCADESNTIGLLQADATARGFSILPNRNIQICPYLTLPESVASFHSDLSSNMRYNIRRRTRQLQKQGFEMQVVDQIGQYDFAFMEMVRLHNLRWQADSLPGNFQDPRVLKFHKMLLSSKQKSWQPVLFFLAGSYKSVAALYGFRYKNKFLYYQAGYDPAYLKYSPGMALMALVIEYAIKEHLNEFDFLRGNEPYKWKWTHEYRRTTSYSISQRKMKCSIQAILDYSYQELKRQLIKPGNMGPILDGQNKQHDSHRTKRNNGSVLGKPEHHVHIWND